MAVYSAQLDNFPHISYEIQKNGEYMAFSVDLASLRLSPAHMLLDEAPQSASLTTLPNDPFKMVLSFLEAPDLVPCALVCKKWKTLSLETLVLQLKNGLQETLLSLSIAFLECDTKKLSPEDQEAFSTVYGDLQATIQRIKNPTPTSCTFYKECSYELSHLLSRIPLEVLSDLQTIFFRKRKSALFANLIQHAKTIALFHKALNISPCHAKREEEVQQTLDKTAFQKFTLTGLWFLDPSDELFEQTPIIVKAFFDKGHLPAAYGLMLKLCTCDREKFQQIEFQNELREVQGFLLATQIEQKSRAAALVNSLLQQPLKSEEQVYRLCLYFRVLGAEEILSYPLERLFQDKKIRYDIIEEALQQGKREVAKTLVLRALALHGVPDTSADSLWDPFVQYFSNQGYLQTALSFRPLCKDPQNFGYLHIFLRLLFLGYLEQAYAFCKENKGFFDKDTVQCCFDFLSDTFLQQGNLMRAWEMLQQIPDKSIAPIRERFLTLHQAFLEKRDFDHAVEVLGDPRVSAQDICQSAKRLILNNDWEGAKRLLAFVGDMKLKEPYLFQLMNAYIESGEYDRAREIAVTLPEHRERSILIARLIQHIFPSKEAILDLFPLIKLEDLPDALKTEIQEDYQASLEE